MKEEIEITYIATDIDVFDIKSKKLGIIGKIIYQEKIKLWCLKPKENIYYKPVHLALIIKKLNDLNDYKKGENNDNNRT
jgi:hypothetical protein